MNPNFKTNKFVYLTIALAVIILDQWTKYLIAANLIPEQVIPVFPFFSLVYTFNTGAAFSFLADASGWQEWLFGGIAFIVSLAIIRWLFVTQNDKPLIKISLMLVLGGALGNLIDRILFGHVRDFLFFYWKDFFSWPAFNIADCAITIGVALYIFLGL